MVLPIPVPQDQQVSSKDMVIEPAASASAVPAVQVTDPAAHAAKEAQRLADKKSSMAYEKEQKISVPLSDCWQEWSHQTTVDSYNCPVCKKGTKAHTSMRFKTFPNVLMIQASRFVYDQWVPRKLGMWVSDAALRDGCVLSKRWLSCFACLLRGQVWTSTCLLAPWT